MANPMTQGAMSRNESERCRTSIGSWWQISSRNSRPDESWYWEYWFERNHSPDLAFRFARLLHSLLRWLIDGVRWSLKIVKGGDVGDEKPTEAARRWSPIVWDLGGLAVILLSFIAGSWIVGNFDIPIPNGVMGMILLLCLLRLSVVPVDFVRRASAGLLYLLPVLFVPLYVEPFSDWPFWVRYASSLLPIVAIGGAAMLLLAYFLARMFRR